MPSQAYKDLLDRAWELHVAKNAGYAGADNPDPWANFRMCEAFGITAFEGCMVRLSDKYIRITNLMRSPSNERVGESIRDTLLDLSAYAMIAVCLLDEQEAKERPGPTEVGSRFVRPQFYQKALNYLSAGGSLPFPEDWLEPARPAEVNRAEVCAEKRANGECPIPTGGTFHGICERCAPRS